MELELQNLFNEYHLIMILKKYHYSPNLIIIHKNIYMIDTHSGAYYKIDAKHININTNLCKYYTQFHVLDNHIYWISGKYLMIMNLYDLIKQSILVGTINNIKCYDNKMYVLCDNSIIFVYNVINHELSYFAKSGSFMDIIYKDYIIFVDDKINICDNSRYVLLSHRYGVYSTICGIIDNIIIVSDKDINNNYRGIKFMDMFTGKIIGVIEHKSRNVNSILICENRLLTITNEEIKIWSIIDYELMSTLKIKSDKAELLNNTLIVYYGGVVNQYDLNGKFIKKIFNLHKYDHVSCTSNTMVTIKTF